ncbi:MAG: DUF389 domain-containing protein [Muribaculaceae bacterium]
MSIKEMMTQWRGYFNLMPDKEDEAQIVDQISSGASFRGSTLWVLIFAIFIACLGLNVNSTAVIIGAMLISPLMGPIIGMGLAVGINDLELLKRAAKNFGVATLISVLTATLYFLITPLGEAQSELLARTSPTIYDVLIALCGGAAGIIALCTKGKGNVIPGVAIATALMPPLCTAGYGLATGHLLYFLGAFYLFFINTVFISFATYLCVRRLRFSRHEFISPERAKKARRILVIIVFVTMIPAVVMTVGIVRRSILDNNINRFVKVELSQPGTQVMKSSIDGDTHTLVVVAVGKEISESKQKAASDNMQSYGLQQYKLNVIQGEQSDSILHLSDKLQQISITSNDDKKKLAEMSSQMAQSQAQLQQYEKVEQLTIDMREEIKVLFPHVKAIALSRVTEADCDSLLTRQFVMALVSVDKKIRLGNADVEKLHQWLKLKLPDDSVTVIQQLK